VVAIPVLVNLVHHPRLLELSEQLVLEFVEFVDPVDHLPQAVMDLVDGAVEGAGRLDPVAGDLGVGARTDVGAGVADDGSLEPVPSGGPDQPVSVTGRVVAAVRMVGWPGLLGLGVAAVLAGALVQLRRRRKPVGSGSDQA
jgi:hypothetical protein